MNARTTRLKADERRESIIAEAMREFAAHGFSGTSTQAIAERVGVSQPYLFQLFGTKRDLFLAVARECFRRVRTRFESVAREAKKGTSDPDEVLHAMGHAYIDMLRDRDMLRLQLQAYAACDDPDIRAVVQQEWTALYDAVTNASGASDEHIHEFFAEGMLLNVAAAIGDLDAAFTLRFARPAHKAD
jgi:AcrR family transcriptional regulator